MGVTDIQELKDDIKNLDKKLDKNEENMNKRLEKNEENMNKFMEVTSNAINKMADVITDIKCSMAKDYAEKSDLKEIEKNINDRIENNNTNRKNDIKQLEFLIIDNKKDSDSKIEALKNNDSISISQTVKYAFITILGTGIGLGIAQLWNAFK